MLVQLLSTSLPVQEVWGSILGLLISDTVSLGSRHRCAKLRRWAPLLVSRFGVIPWYNEDLIFDFVHIHLFNFLLLPSARFAHLLKTPLLLRKVLRSIPWRVESNPVSPITRHRCDVSSELCCSGAKSRRWASALVTLLDVIRRV